MAFWIPVTKGLQAAGRAAASGTKKAGQLGAKGAKQVGKAGAKAGTKGAAKGAHKGGRTAADQLARKGGQAAARHAGKTGKAGARAGIKAKTGGLSPDTARHLGRGARQALGRGGSLPGALRRLGGSGGGDDQDGEGGGRKGRGGGVVDGAAGADQALRRFLRRRLQSRRGPFKKARRRTSFTLTLLLTFVLLMPFCTAAFGASSDDEEALAAMAMQQQGGGVCPQDLAAVAERTGIPEEAVAAYCLGATRYEMDWTILAAIGKMECDHGRSTLPGCPRDTHNKCGARGPLQFLGNVWRKGTDPIPIGDCPGVGPFTGNPDGPPIPDGRESDGYATDGNGDGTASPWTWPDATAAAARYLVHHGVEDDPQRAVARYNAKASYIRDVLDLAAELRRATAGMYGTGGSQLLGGCPGQPEGSTDPIPAGNNTPATQTMANSLIACFGRNGHDVGCYSRRTQGNGSEGPYEHPRGRACDFMMSNGVAGGNDKDRGRAMAEYAMKNADELNILYVIWFNKVWSVSRDKGPIPWDQWRSYGCGDCGASGGHYNHVHVSVELMPGDPALANCRAGISCSE